MSGSGKHQAWTRREKVFRGTQDDLRAMKRALANAQLGPTAVMALSAAIIAIEADEPTAQKTSTLATP